MVKRADKIRKLELRFAEKLASLDDEALGDVCAGILDIPDSYRAIFDFGLPRLETMRPDEIGPLLDELTELRSHFEHIRWHAEAATGGLDRLIELLGSRELTTNGR